MIRKFFIGSVILFGAIGFAAWMKNHKAIKSPPPLMEIPVSPVVKNDLSRGVPANTSLEGVRCGVTANAPGSSSMLRREGGALEGVKPPLPPKIIPPAPKPQIVKVEVPIPEIREHLPNVNLIERLFATDATKLPIVETVSFTSRVPWLKGRPAWVADYANFYQTSRHFIARSLNGKPDYFNQKVSLGDRFNVFRKDKNLSFQLLVDLSRCRMFFYYIDQDEKVLLKTYRVGLGKADSTPVGKCSLGDKVAIYKPDTTGYFQDQKVEMIRIFGTRWIPFEGSEEMKGLGLQGLPWINDPATGQLVEDTSKLGKYDSNGSIRLSQEDIEEIFAIVLTKPTTVELVKEYKP